MNILVIGHYGLYRHLSASFVHQQAKTYGELGHNVRVLIPIPLGKAFNKKKFGPGFFRTEADGIQLNYLRYASFSNIGKRHINNKSAVLALRPHLKKLFSDFTPDVIHAHTLGLDSGIGAWLKKRFGCPLVVTTHGSDAFVPFNSGKKEHLRHFAKGADTVVCVSSLLERTVRDSGVSEPTEVILNGFRVNEVRSRPKDPLTIVQAGYLVARKKADITIRAVALLKRDYPDIKLKIIGNGTEEQRFRELASTLGVSENVIFTGYLSNPELLAEMSSATFFVMPSINEGFGIVYLEAMANHCVTIGTEGEGIADLIRHGENGFLVPPDSPESISAIISQCIGTPEKTLEIAGRGYLDATELTWAKNAAKYLELFSELISHSKR
ncbi:MAG: glycosyltransferase family 4 protein [Ruminococcaceae bacterium]|nr:glycosyltransferase family 4 protein [Oscillospiraceae bacterium]